MTWRTIVVSKNAKLDYQLGYMVIRMDSIRKVHLSELAIVILESTAISMTAYLLNELSKKKIKVIFCDEKRNPSFEMIPYYGSHDSSLKIRSQITWETTVKEDLWTLIVKEKIRNQGKLLKALNKQEYSMLEHYVSEVEYNDKTNREGHAAKVYFNSLFGMNFTRSSDCNINSGLNYGYSILLSIFNREITSNGYLTQLGMFHDNMFNPFNFSSDLMEPFRVIVDECIFKLNLENFDRKEKIDILSILEKELIIESRREVLPNAIKIYCKSIFDALNSNNYELAEFFEYEF